MFSSRFNLNDFFKHGYTVTQLDVKLADQVLEWVEAEKFDKLSQRVIYKDRAVEEEMGKSYPSLWTVDGEPTQAFDRITWKETYTNFWNEVLQDDYFSFFRKTFGNFSNFCMLGHEFKAGDELGWHRDLIESTYFGNILYLGDNDYTRDDGGYLRIGRTQLDSTGLPLIRSLKIVGEVLPNHGTMVTISNMNPCILHDVVQLKNQKKRYTHACRFGFMENRLAKKKMMGGGWQ